MSERRVLIFLAAVYVLLVAWGLSSDAVWDDDCIARFYNVRNALVNPEQFISTWNRPLFTLFFVLPFQFGRESIVFGMSFVAVAMCWAVYQAAVELRVKNAWLVIPFTIFQAFVFPVSFNALAEPLAACLIAFGILFYVRKDWLWFAVSGSLLPLARLELSVLSLLCAVVLWWHNRKLLPILVAPLLLWNLAGWVIDGDSLYLYHATLGKAWGENRYGHTEFWSYFQRYIFVTGPVVFYFLIIGLFENRKWWLTLLFAVTFMVYVIFSWKLNIGQAAGFLRHLVVLGPVAGLLALEGYNRWVEGDSLEIGVVSVLVWVATFGFFSRELTMHHVVSAEHEYWKLVIIGILALLHFAMFNDWFYYIKNCDLIKKVHIPIFIILLTAGYTLATEAPGANDNPERRLMSKVADWYVENAADRPTYCNHSWLYWESGRDWHADDRLTQANLEAAPVGSVVIWESHYGHRLAGDVQLEWFEGKPFAKVAALLTPDKKFLVVIYERVQ